MSAPLLRLDGISKSYGGVHALTDVAMSINEGEVHALCGENGAGKSTLIKILTGVIFPDAGQLEFAGQPLPVGHVLDCERAGIAAMHQESTAFPDLDAVDNLFVGHELLRWGGWLLDRGAMRRQTREILARLGEQIDERISVGNLPLAQRQIVAMARALLRNCRLLIMDEPTASLSARETELLLGVIRKLRNEGVSVLYVSHRLEEVFAIADRVTVLRDGQFVTTRPVSSLTSGELVQLMVGRDIQAVRRDPEDRVGAATGKPILEVEGLSRDDSFRNVTFHVSAGEVLGIAGLVGAGRSEVARSVFGIDGYDAGEVRVAGSRLTPHSVSAAIASGLALVPEDRQHEGLVLPMSVGQNLSMSVLSTLTQWGFLKSSQEADLVNSQLELLSVKASSPRAAAATLSGGNQQKLVLGKWLACRPQVLILDEPTRGVDVGAKDQFHRLIRELAADGAAVIVISSELPEILSLSDRIVVMREGQLVGELPAHAATQESVLEMALPLGDSVTV